MDTSSIWTVFHQKMHRYLEKRVACRADADDLLQEIFVKIHLKLPTLASEESLPFWVWRLTRNTLLDYYKKRRLPVTGLAEADLKMPVEDGEDFNHHFAECVAPFLDLLPPDRREAIQLADFQRVPQKELAEIWGIGYSGAKSRVQRARVELRELFTECCAIETDCRGNILDFTPHKNPSPAIQEVRVKIAENLKKSAEGCVFPCAPRLSN